MNFAKLTLFFVFIIIVINAQTVSTLTAPFDASGDIAVDSLGNIYVANYGKLLNGQGSGGGAEVYKVTPSGEVSIFATGLNGASGNEFGSDGILYQSNISIGTVSKIDQNGNVSTFSSGHSAPVGITLDKQGNVYVANCGNSTIRKVDKNGVSTLFASSTLLNCPNGLTIDDEGNLYTCNFGNGNVLKITPDGIVSVLTVLAGRNNGHITYKNNRLYVVSRGAHKVYEVSLTGDWKVIAGTGIRGKQDGPAAQATFSLPNGIGLSPDGNTIYINDEVPLTGNVILTPVVVRKIDGILGNTTSINNENEIPNKFLLKQNYPNPFNPSTKIEYQIPNNGLVSLKIYDLLGQEITTLVNGIKNTGNYSIEFNSGNIPSGVYFYRLLGGEFSITKKMLIQK